MIAIGRILVLDDSAMMRMVLRKSLSMAKVQANEIVEATDGQVGDRAADAPFGADAIAADRVTKPPVQQLSLPFGVPFAV